MNAHTTQNLVENVTACVAEVQTRQEEMNGAFSPSQKSARMSGGILKSADDALPELSPTGSRGIVSFSEEGRENSKEKQKNKKEKKKKRTSGQSNEDEELSAEQSEVFPICQKPLFQRGLFRAQ
jgi:hypothetical protein